MPGLVPGIHESRARSAKTWMARSSPAMTENVIPASMLRIAPECGRD